MQQRSSGKNLGSFPAMGSLSKSSSMFASVLSSVRESFSSSSHTTPTATKVLPPYPKLFFLIGMVTFALLAMDNVQMGTAFASPAFQTWNAYRQAVGLKPWQAQEIRRAINNRCPHRSLRRDLCERCAKFTRNEVVFPFCCDNKDGVEDWCRKFLDFALD